MTRGWVPTPREALQAIVTIGWAALAVAVIVVMAVAIHDLASQ